MLGRLLLPWRVPLALRQSLIYGLALAAVKSVSLLMVPVFTHFLEPADYGRLDILQTLADLFSIVIGVGLADTLFRFAGSAETEKERRASAANLFGFSIIVGIIALIATQISAPVVAALLPGDVSVVQTRLILGTLAMSGISLFLLSWLRMRDKSVLYLSSSLGRVVLQAGGAAMLLWLGMGVTGVLVAGLIAASALALGLSIWCLRHTGISFEAARYKTYLLYGGPLVLTGMAGFILGSFDRWILADAIGPAAMAEYALAAKMALITAFAIQPFDLWWLPNRFKILKSQNGLEKCGRAVGIGVTIAVAAAVGVALGGPAVILLVTPETYHGAVVYVPYLAALAAVHAVTTMFNLGVMSGETTFRPLLIDSTAAAAAVVGYLTLIPAYGGYGAIAATAIALTGRLVVTYRISQKILHIPYRLDRMALLGGLGLAAIIWLPKADGIIAPILWAVGSGMAVMILSLIIKLAPNPLATVQ
jgi:O-antigen/teichoic acid export membrane protein